MRDVSPLGLFPLLHSLRKHENRLPLPMTGRFKDAWEEWLCWGCSSVRAGQKNLAEATLCALELKCFVVTGLRDVFWRNDLGTNVDCNYFWKEGEMSPSDLSPFLPWKRYFEYTGFPVKFKKIFSWMMNSNKRKDIILCSALGYVRARRFICQHIWEPKRPSYIFSE